MEGTAICLDDYIDMRSANEWMRAAKELPVPKMVFGEMWLEGEIAIMFGDTGVGKSALAVQIAEGIARGRAVEPMEMRARPQRVVYLDFELSKKQFEMRYTAEQEPEGSDKLRKQYHFSDRLKRIALKPEVFRQDGGQPFETVLRHLIEPIVERSGTRILIIDNITYLKRTADNSRDAAPLMKELKRLKEKYGLSILVIAHTPKRDTRRPLVLNDMQGSKVIANFADSVFAIGQSKRDPAERYVKHIKMRSTEMFCGTDNVPVFRMKKIGGNFLGLEFRCHEPEAGLLNPGAGRNARQTIEQVKRLSGEGMSIRRIAEELDLSKTTVHRYLHMRPGESGVDIESGAGSQESGAEKARKWNYFPGCEEYEEAKREPRFKGMFAREDQEAYLIRREHWLISSAQANAHKVYKITGKAPPLGADEKYRAFKDAVRAFEESGGEVVSPPIADIISRTALQEDLSAKGHERTQTTGDRNVERGDESAGATGTPLDGMKHVIDDYGNKRWVESEYDSGKPRVWYQYRSDGKLLRWEHNGFAFSSAMADEERFGGNGRSEIGGRGP